MDIDLLSKMVKEMILDNDSVTLPGIGSFVAEVVPATFSDKGYTINPPYRRLFFRQRHQDDSRLIDFYCQSNGVAPADGKRILTEFLAGLKEILIEKKNVILPGLGRLRATKENNFFFVPDEDLDIYPNGYGLEPISLKTHQETEEEVSAAIAGLRSIIEEPVEEPVVVPEPEPIDISLPDEEPIVEVAPEPETPVEPAPEIPVVPVVEEPAPAEPEAPVKEKAPRNPWMTLGLVLGTLLLAVALFLLIFVILAKVDPEFIDSLLYSPEELRILNY
jgi:nucleoid DNA-binding protein